LSFRNINESDTFLLDAFNSSKSRTIKFEIT
jgi:hypothetical protein